MFNRRHLFAAAFAASLLAASTAIAQDQAIVGISTVTTYSVDATITAIDTANQTATLTLADGRSVTHKVSDAVKALGVGRVGDRVSAAFEDRLSFVLSGPNTKTPRDRDISVRAGAAAGDRAAGVVAGQAVVNWLVVSVDTAGNKISLVDPAGGQVRTYDVTTAEGRSQLPRVKPGDRLTAINTQVLIVAITPKK